MDWLGLGALAAKLAPLALAVFGVWWALREHDRRRDADRRVGELEAMNEVLNEMLRAGPTDRERLRTELADIEKRYEKLRGAPARLPRPGGAVEWSDPPRPGGGVDSGV